MGNKNCKNEMNPQTIQEMIQDLNAINKPFLQLFKQYPYILPFGKIRKPYSNISLYVLSTSEVDDKALDIACSIITNMLKTCQPSVLKNLNNSRVEIIGKNEVMSILMDYAAFRNEKTTDGRSYDNDTRGIGGTLTFRVTSCGEENLLHLPTDKYSSENILVHEFSHYIMNALISQDLVNKINVAFVKAKINTSFNQSEYNLINALEYWAEGSQAWFNASKRTNVNNGINSRALLLLRDPDLFKIMQEVYGNNKWGYYEYSIV